MSQFELIKTIEAKKLNKRSHLPIGGPPATIPYAALIEVVVREHDEVTFAHLSELYLCSDEVFSEAARPLGATRSETAGDKTAEQATPGAEVVWEEIRSSHDRVARAKVPGGWLVNLERGTALALTFYPDPDHRWTEGRLT